MNILKIDENNSYYHDINNDKSKEAINYLLMNLNQIIALKRNNMQIQPGHLLIDYHLTKEKIFDYNNIQISNYLINEKTILLNSLINGNVEGFTSYHKQEKKIKSIIIYGQNYIISTPVLFHELAHGILLYNSVTLEKCYCELLSIFLELLISFHLNKKYNNLLIMEEETLISRLNCIREYIKVNDKDNKLIEFDEEIYPYILGTIYSYRILEIYINNQEDIIREINLILSGKKDIRYLLNKYNISLSDEETLSSFIKKENDYKKLLTK